MSNAAQAGIRAPLSSDSENPAARLHSRYKPQAEAERYLDALKLSDDMQYFILIEPGLGYLIRTLENRYRTSKIIVLHADSRFRELAAEYPQVPAWYPDSALAVQDFLEGEIPDVQAASVRIIEWRPSLARYGDAYLKLVSETVEFIKRADANHRTTGAFGKRWFKNFFRNIGLVRRALLFRPLDIPIIITGSGPGLEEALPQIANMRETAFILAASSSLLALAEKGIEPDMTISTDGGAWALMHLYSCFRAPPALLSRNDPHCREPFLALALSAALPSQCAVLPFLILNDGSLWQSIILGALNIPQAIIPQRGTVTASALELAMLLSSGNIYLAGMDLAVRDIRTHARPYGFDHLFYGAASRLQPVYSQCFTRSTGISQGGSHAVYAAWFRKQLASWPKRIFSLGGNHTVFEEYLYNGREDNSHGRLAALKDHFKIVALSGEPSARCRKAAGALINALDDSRYAKTLCEELTPLLFPAGGEIPAQNIKEAISGITARYGENNG